MHMKNILLLGCGKIGAGIAQLLLHSGDYRLRLADANPEHLKKLSHLPEVSIHPINVNDVQALRQVMHGCDAVICALSYHYSVSVAEAALAEGVSYFDLTEDLQSTRKIREMSKEAQARQIFMPQCGLAPGFTAIVANDLIQRFEKPENVYVRVGALPLYPSNSLKYNLTWSTDGLINEYCQTCEALSDGTLIDVPPLSDLETFSIDGVRYEAFHTSGGLGTLCRSLIGKARSANYKTVRYPGHRDYARFLIEELQLKDHQRLLKSILEKAIPITHQDVVLIFTTASGWIHGQLEQITDARKIYHAKLFGQPWSAIQITTAAGICAAVDLFFQGALPRNGFVRQEEIPLNTFLSNRFGQYYAIGNQTGTDVQSVQAVVDPQQSP